jgi:tetratricopeptide (TPR) repeat protein
VVFVLTFGVFANSIGNGFVYDDLAVIEGNTRLEDPWDLKAFFTTSYWDEDKDALYRPLTIWSWALDQGFFGAGPLPVHFSNVLFGSLVASLVYVFLFFHFRNRSLALVAALLFGLHPVHTEVMANGVGRSEIMSTFFLLVAAILHVAASSRQTARFLVPAACAYLVAMLFKESAAVLPGLLVLVDWLVIEKGSIKVAVRRWRGYVFYAAALVVFLLIRSSVVSSGLPPVQEVMQSLDGPARVLYASKVLLAYLAQLSFPWTLLAEYSDYRNPISVSASDPGVLLSIVTWILLAVVGYRLLRRGTLPPAFGIAWFFVAVLPVSNLLFPIGTVRADRLLFLPSLGFCVAVAWILVELEKRKRYVAWTLFAVVLVFYSWRSVTRNMDWKSQESLWATDLAKNPGAATGWALIGNVHRDRGEWAEAEAAYRRAFELRDTIGFYPEAHNNYAALMKTKGDLAETKKHYRLVLKKRPDQFTALVNLGEMLVHADSTRTEAIRFLTRAIEIESDDVAPRINLTQAYDYNAQYDLALETIGGAIGLEPTRSDLWDIKAGILGRAGRTEEARQAAARANQLRGGTN